MSENWHKGKIKDKERMRQGHWLESVLCVSIIALTLVVGCRKDIWPIKKLCSTDFQRFPSRRWREEGPMGNWLTRFTL